MREVIYVDCDLTKEESEVLIMSAALRHHLTDAALKDLIKLIDCHLPRKCHVSKYSFLKSFPVSNYRTYYYCPDCIIILNFLNGELTGKCDNCSKEYNERKLKSEKKYFFYFPLKIQLIALINSEHYLHFRKESDTESDIINGTLYRKLKSKNIIRKNDISIQWNTDGVQLFNSSSRSMWPILVTVNELPYRLRKHNMMVTGLWFDSVKPVMNTFLKPFVEELIDLHENGFQSTTFIHNKPIQIHVHILVAPVDSIARSMIQCIKQFNGKYGCSYCYHKGERIQLDNGHGFKNVYMGDVRLLRKQRHYVMQAEKALQTSKPVKGVMNASIALLLPLFDVISSFPPDYLHSVAEGGIKQFVIAWFDSKNHKQAWSLRKYEACFDTRLTDIQPPCEITRTPQSITQRSQWKASEYKNFLLYYSLICLDGLLPKKYVKHWLLYVYSMHIFLKTKISDDEYITATFAIRTFVLDIEKLYGVHFMNYNIHLLLHIPAAVRKFGALWAWSTFPFEGFNHILQNSFNGTQYVPDQICKFYVRFNYIKQSTVFDRKNCSGKGKAVFDAIINECKIKKCIEYPDTLRAFGSSREMELTATEKCNLEFLLGQRIKNTVLTFERFIYKNILYHGANYSRLEKRSNSTIITKQKSILVILYLCIVETLTGAKYNALLCNKLQVIHDEELVKNGNISSQRFSYIVEKSDNISCCRLDEIENKCICIKLENRNNKLCIIPLVNCIETD